MPAEQCQELREWVEINSHSENLEGLAALRKLLVKAFSPLADHTEEKPLPPRLTLDSLQQLVERQVAPAQLFIRRAEAPLQLLLVGHMDTVFPKESSFSHFSIDESSEKAYGPGVADMKGGLYLLLRALRRFEATSPKAVGWKLLITPDEEVGSPSSRSLVTALANESDAAFVFEPALPGGGMALERPSSSNELIQFFGRTAHVGRDFSNGRSAVIAAAQLVLALSQMELSNKKSIANVGKIGGGLSANCVPEEAFCLINLRAATEESRQELEAMFEASLEQIARACEVSYQRTTLTMRPPKVLSAASRRLLAFLDQLAADHQILLGSHSATGGVCDGNFIAATGTPVIDTMGAVGGGLHTEGEFAYIEFYESRAELFYRLLLAFEQGRKP